MRTHFKKIMHHFEAYFHCAHKSSGCELCDKNKRLMKIGFIIINFAYENINCTIDNYYKYHRRDQLVTLDIQFMPGQVLTKNLYIRYFLMCEFNKYFKCLSNIAGTRL